MRKFILLATCLALLTSEGALGDQKCLILDAFSQIVDAVDCGKGFCCGSCNNRYCCSDRASQLNQTSDCSTCLAYSDFFGYKFESQKCNASAGEFCCGWCDNRYCCSQPDYSLNQAECQSYTTTSKPKTKQTSTKTSKPIKTTSYNYWSPFYYYAYNVSTEPSMFWLKLSLGALPFIILACLLCCFISARSKQRKTLKTIPSTISNQNVAVATVLPASGNIPNTVLNEDLNALPNYEATKARINGAFIYPPEELPRYDHLRTTENPRF